MGSSGLHGMEHSRDRSGAGMFGGIEFIVVLRTVLPGWQMSKGDVYSCWKRFCNYENNFSNRADELQYTILKKTRTLAGETGNRGHRRQSKGSDLSARGKGQQGVVIAPSAHHQVMAGPWLLPLSLHTRMPSRETIIFSRWPVLPPSPSNQCFLVL